MTFPNLSETFRLQRLKPPQGKIQMVLDTDTYNEIDDQFAVVYALLSPEKIDVEAIYAAPFHNNRSSGPADGMEKSYEEILRLLDRLNVSPEGFVFRGSTEYLPKDLKPVESEAAADLVERAMARPVEGDPLYVVPIGTPTNIASAILMEPRIIERIVVVWLGGHAHYWPNTREFNLDQDVPASRILFDCGVPFVQIPCMGVTSHLLTTVPEIEAYVRGRGRIGDYLADIFADYHSDHYAWSKVIWDISAIAWLLNSESVPTQLVHSPILTDQVTWSFDSSRHWIRCAHYVHRDMIFKDLFQKIEQHAAAKES